MKSWTTRPIPALPGSAPQLHLHETTANAAVPVPAREVQSLYVCGITPYDATHMGHAATYVAFDMLHRVWLDQGSKVSYVQNVTDVDDPLLERAAATGVNWADLAAEQIELFRGDMEALNVIAPQHYISVVETINWMVPAIESMLESDLAYRVAGGAGEPDGDIYFDVVAASEGHPDAWKLGSVSGLDREVMLELSAQRGGDPDRPGKRDALDPLLWRAAREGEPSWAAGSLGQGRPGWHIECTVIARNYLPEPFTVQAGGSDLVFPHHEMGAGHYTALSGGPMARHYAHAGMVGLDGEKMSKSLGNLVLVSRLRADGVDPAAIRLAILAQHYRSDWFWTDAVLETAKERLAAWRSAAALASKGSVQPMLDQLRAALADDLDTPAALAAVDAWAAGLTTAEGNLPDPREEALFVDVCNALLGIEL